jgi:hypothetical protein
MLKIAVCDNEIHELSRITGLLKEYQAKRSAAYIYLTASGMTYISYDREEFLKVHRSFIMNMTQIKELLPGKIITVSNHEIPISKHRYVQVRECYMQYLFLEKGVL